MILSNLLLFYSFFSGFRVNDVIGINNPVVVVFVVCVHAKAVSIVCFRQKGCV